MKYMYPACFYPEDNGQFSVIFPDLGSIATYGNDLNDAIKMAIDLLCSWILECKKDKVELPNPSNYKDIKPESQNGFVNLIYVDIDEYIKKKQ